ncbi:hypothetical protein F2Q69_00038045 [Brassica cretica]|uniref:Uncharacterized protein n=1 Tax=Brassica cretica TaxID=69181 RepID=A0A8S9SNY4_BRACR|nr:hypothetical protein F2Q69_00038045 [Brassica cretica]
MKLSSVLYQGFDYRSLGLLLGSLGPLRRLRRLCFREKVTPLASFSPASFPRRTILSFDGGSVSGFLSGDSV